MRVAMIVMALLGLVATANAAIVVDVDPGVDVGGGLTSYTVRLVSDTADGATAWDGSFDGPMNQVLELGMIATPSLTRAVAPMPNENEDSHFLFLNDSLLIETAPYETDIKLAGTFGIKPAYVLENLPFAQIVLVSGASVVMSGQAADINGMKFDTNVVIPEPMTMALLAIGGLGALIRRRRA